MSTLLHGRPARSREEALRLLEQRVCAQLPRTVPAVAATLGVSEGAIRAVVLGLRRAGVLRIVSRDLDHSQPVWGRRGRAVYGLVAMERSA